ncbi:carbohydrate ABC transporter permease [Spiractinospora alimapuensis]|uniref:carbohydrate ABC transporter permease n=1 Tax=Spiractinospora alimapuensis TaxID=2820884 RepID=UPI001F2757CF|nr:carbohydrate ABC transporter permease [Spiractinospora alimapuensis]QVQ52223.1 carbohydrate ABC transporter permease [Spiractinospora alimapuensis]
MTHQQGNVVVRYGSLALVMGFILLPGLWLLVSSFESNRTLFASEPTWWLEDGTLENYAWAIGGRGLDIGGLMVNSLIVCALTALITAIFACLAGYGLARYQGWGARIAIVVLLVAQMVQGPMITLPWYQIAMNLDLLDTRTILVLVYQTITLPAAVWLMSGFFRSIPRDLEDAAYVDGASRLRTLITVVLPLAKPGITAIALYAFILAWNDYQYALIFTSTPGTRTVQIGIAQVMASLGATNWGGILAAGVLAVIPVIVLFALAQRTLIQGLTSGAVKH